MGESYSVKKIETLCTCEVPGADQDPLCLHCFSELDISSSDSDDLYSHAPQLESDKASIFHDLGEIENENEDESEIESVFAPVGFDFDEPLSPNPNLTGGNLNGNELNSSPGKKLKSAMKGSHEKEGKMVIKSDLRVKWAPDVYDPPVTSDDHTMKRVSYKKVKSLKKEYYNKHKYAKSKGANSKSDRKKTSSSSSSKVYEQRMMRLIARHEKAIRNNCQNSPPKLEESHVQDKIISDKKNEVKFGRNFCRELVDSPLHRSLAEAS